MVNAKIFSILDENALKRLLFYLFFLKLTLLLGPYLFSLMLIMLFFSSLFIYLFFFGECLFCSFKFSITFFFFWVNCLDGQVSTPSGI